MELNMALPYSWYEIEESFFISTCPDMAVRFWKKNCIWPPHNTTTFQWQNLCIDQKKLIISTINWKDKNEQFWRVFIKDFAKVDIDLKNRFLPVSKKYMSVADIKPGIICKINNQS